MALIKEARKNLRKDDYIPTSKTPERGDYLGRTYDKIRMEHPEIFEADNLPLIDNQNAYASLEYLAKGLKYLNDIMLVCPCMHYTGKDRTYKKAYFPELQHPIITDLQEKIYDILTE